MKTHSKVALAALLAGALGSAWYGLRTPQPPAQPRDAPDASVAPDSEELQLMNGAEAALASGDTERAFSLLYEHATKFPKGRLLRQRQAVHVETLCRVGKIAEAREETSDFLAQDPASPLAARVRGACASPR